MGGLMGGGGKGGGGGGDSLSPTQADQFFTNVALGQNEQAIHNRYTQLGIGTPGGGGGNAKQAAASGGSLTYGGPSTMEQMDVGTIPSRTGGAIGMAEALSGQLFNPEQAAGFGPGGPLEQLALQQQQQEQSGFGAATGGFGGLAV
jgi:hypothetical protein